MLSFWELTNGGSYENGIHIIWGNVSWPQAVSEHCWGFANRLICIRVYVLQISHFTAEIREGTSHHLGLPIHTGLFPSAFPTTTLYLFSSVHVMCGAYFILLNLITQILIDEAYKPRWSWLRGCLQTILVFSSEPQISRFTSGRNFLKRCHSVPGDDIAVPCKLVHPLWKRMLQAATI
jgi:hypothetical protein